MNEFNHDVINEREPEGQIKLDWQFSLAEFNEC